MSIRYTPQAIELIRAMAMQGLSHLQVRARTGWTDSFLTSVCRTHGIDLRGCTRMRESVDVLLEHAQIDLSQEERIFVVNVLAAQCGLVVPQ